MASNIQALIILDHSGVPLFFAKTDPLLSKIDLPLVTSFLQATIAFDSEGYLGEMHQDMIILNYGYSKICFERGIYVDAVLITKAVTKRAKNILEAILENFQEKFCTNCYAKDHESCLSCAIFSQIKSPYFDSFYHELSHFPRLLGWDPNWIPFLKVPKIDSIEFTPQTDVLELIDGVLTLEDVLLIYYKNDHVVYDLLLAYNHDIIDFKKAS